MEKHNSRLYTLSNKDNNQYIGERLGNYSILCNILCIYPKQPPQRQLSKAY